MSDAYTGAMNDLEALRQELADLRREVKTLKRTRWITPGALALSLVALVAVGVAAPRTQDQTHPDHTPLQLSQDLVCKSIKVVDANGAAMLQLGSDKDGGLFVMNGADGKKRFFTGVEGGAGFSDWYDAAGARRATVFIGEKGAELRLADKQEHATAVLQQAETGGFMALNGPDGKNRLASGVDNGGGYLDVYDSLGSLRHALYLSEQNTAQLKIVGADKIARFLISGNADTGQAVSYGVDGKPIATFPVKASP
jgi:hypothetical protein